MTRITSATTTTLGRCYGIRLEIAAALTGTVTISDNNGTQAILPIASPAVGRVYYGFTGPVSIVNSATEEITVSLLNRQGT